MWSGSRDSALAFHCRARGLASRRGFTLRRGFDLSRGLGSLGRLGLFGINQREARQERQQANPGVSNRSNIGKFHGYLPSLLCAWFLLLISATLILVVPAGGSKLNRESGSLV